MLASRESMMRIRDFRKTRDAVEMPNLSELQTVGYGRFLQVDRLRDERLNEGLEALFHEVFPIVGPDGVLRMEYLGYELGVPARDEDECRRLGLSYAYPLRVRLRIVGPETVEEDVYLAEIPRMIGSGGFVFNGAVRVIVAQIQRSPGVDFSETVEEGGLRSCSCRLVPERGIWIEFGISRRDVLQVRLGQSGRMPATWLLRAMLPEGANDSDLLALFYGREAVNLIGLKDHSRIEGRYLAGEIADSGTGEIIAEAGKRITRELAESLAASGMREIVLLKNVDDLLLLRTLAADSCKDHADALLHIYGRFRPGEPASVERAAQFFAERFADPVYYNLGKVGRFRINRKFGQDVALERPTLCPDDILNAIRYIIRLRRREGSADDIDDLGNRILRPINKLLEERLRIALSHWQRQVREKLVLNDGKTPSPRAIAASRTIASAAEEFFGRSELSQVLDQTNPLAELNHVRRISALGPGGLNRKRAGFEVRDVHASHYGRICPIETPEGANIGLIASLGIFAKVDEYGFITTPYRPLASDSERQIRYLRADEERQLRLAPATAPLKGEERILGRYGGEFCEIKLSEVNFIDVSPKQIVGISASLIPFLEHNDANRALMGSNMQRQAVPLLRTEAPFVLTGMEKHIAANSGMVVVARRDGVVAEVDAAHVKIGEDNYPLTKFRGLNENTCLNQKPLVSEGQHVKAGEVIADGAATCGGELSLGRNVLVAFMMWDGYNFEDAIIVSESLIESDKYTSIHIEEFTAELRETRLGREEFTPDIPNVPERMLRDLDKRGIVRIGATVRPGDILVGKVAPKTKAELSPEEKLLREIFGKAGIDVTNESLAVPPGSGGVIVDVRHYRRKTHLSDEERSEGRQEARKVRAEYDAKIAESFLSLIERLSRLPRLQRDALPLLPKDAGIREILDCEESFEFDADKFSHEARDEARDIYRQACVQIGELKAKGDNLLRKHRIGDELPSGVLEMVKVHVAVKRVLATGDKMAGRHGNKGVIARIVPSEDMPFLPDGRPVELLLNPLGVPSRMNVGQILETHLGWACHVLGVRALTPVFDGASEEEIAACLRDAGLPDDGKTVLYDGRTGEPFGQKVTVGYIYMMKLNHLVDDKIHARATGPYSMITQQPLGGKARMGGQRLGEMEVWAIEAYGAAHVLQEMLTVKSDDVDGRHKMYESIVKGQNLLEAGLPVSLDVLFQEVRGLGLNIRLSMKEGRKRTSAADATLALGATAAMAAERR